MDGDAHRPGTIQCNAAECRKQFTVTVGSVMESSKVPLTKWVLAFHLLCSSKKGISAKQMQRELGLGSYRTAWFLMHRVRLAMTDGIDAAPKPLSGTVEADETCVGGKPRKGNRKNGQPAPKRKPGRGTPKQPVMVLVGAGRQGPQQAGPAGGRGEPQGGDSQARQPGQHRRHRRMGRLPRHRERVRRRARRHPPQGRGVRAAGRRTRNQRERQHRGE